MVTANSNGFAVVIIKASYFEVCIGVTHKFIIQKRCPTLVYLYVNTYRYGLLWL